MRIPICIEIDDEQLNALVRFNETCEDGQEYDVSRSALRALTWVGLVRWCGGSRFEITDAGISVIEDIKERS